jgi:hypothetical protein
VEHLTGAYCGLKIIRKLMIKNFYEKIDKILKSSCGSAVK